MSGRSTLETGQGNGIPEGWRLAQLGDICEITMGTSPRGHTYNRDGVGEPLLNGPTEFGSRHPSAAQWTTDAVRFAEPGDILFCVRGATTGRKNIADRRYCIGRGLAAIRGRDGLADTDFLWHALDVVTNELVGRAAGSTFVNLPGAELKRFHVPLPPLPAQKRIAGILNQQLAAVERARAAARAQLEAAQALPAAYLREVFEGEHVRSWESRRLGELMTRFNDIIHPGDRAEGEAVFVGLEHIESNTGRRIGSLKLDLGSLTGRKPTFKKGQIVYGYLRPYLNKVWIAEFDGCSSVDQFAFQVHGDAADVSFVAAFMRSDTFLRRSAVVTTTGQLPRISIDEILAVTIDIPQTVADQSRIASDLSARLDHAMTLTQTCQAQIADINALPAALLRAAFQGQL